MKRELCRSELTGQPFSLPSHEFVEFDSHEEADVIAGDRGKRSKRQRERQGRRPPAANEPATTRSSSLGGGQGHARGVERRHEERQPRRGASDERDYGVRVHAIRGACGT